MSTWNDPLTIDIQKQLSAALRVLPIGSPFTSVLQNLEPNGTCLPTISRLLQEPSLTVIIKTAFQPLLVDLCARWLDDNECLDKKLDAFALLVEVHEEIAHVMMEFFRQPAMKGGPLAFVARDSSIESVDVRQMHRTLLAYYRVLRACPKLPHYLMWDLTLLHGLFSTPHSDRGILWLAIRCYALQVGMGEANREEIEKRVLGEIGAEDCSIYSGEDVNGVPVFVDGWILPVTEVLRIQDWRDGILSSEVSFLEEDSMMERILPVQLSPRIANIHGVLLLKEPVTNDRPSGLVLTPSTIDTLRQLAIHLSLRLPVLLTSAPSSGKSAVLHHLAAQVHPSSPNQIVTINLADTSMDPRSLLGSYVSSSKQSGLFEWKDGVLVQAMRVGKWVLLKDIDRGSNETLGLLTPLIESLAPNKRIGVRARLSVPGRGVIEAADSFMLFATRSVDSGEKGTPVPPTFTTALKWAEVIAKPPSVAELKTIVETKFPTIAGPVVDGLVDIWQSAQKLRTVSSMRSIGVRDLEKFCHRVSSLMKGYNILVNPKQGTNDVPSFTDLIPNPSLREDIFLEARDVLFASGVTTKAAQVQQAAIGAYIGERLGLSPESQEWILHRRSPDFEIEKDVDGRLVAVRAGRTRLTGDVASGVVDLANKVNFSMHKPALKLMSQLATCVAAAEPVLLTGETGTGKTTIITYLASLLNRPLLSLNMSNQTESSDLIGGFKPINALVPATELHNRFTEMFSKTFSRKRNESFEPGIRKAINDRKWKAVVKAWSSTAKLAIDKIQEKSGKDAQSEQPTAPSELDSTDSRKRQKTRHGGLSVTEAEWRLFEKDVRDFEVQHVRNSGKFAFQFVEGPLVKAIRSGSWVLLDEVNLASPETLECVSSLLQSETSSITLTEQGSLEPVPRHPSFRIFACMNPATDVGKRDLPANIRNRFTEIDVPPPDRDRETLLNIITHYIGSIAIADKGAILDVAQFYTGVKELAESGRIADGCDHRPHFNMRTLSRALIFAKDVVQQFGLRRALWEGFTMTFTMVLNKDSEVTVADLARRTLLSTVKNHSGFLSKPTSATRSNEDAVPFGPFGLTRGPLEEDPATDYILSPSVQKKLVDLARIILTGRFPVLIQGPTSSGKTSAVHYLARRTGHRMVRINNHEHTDIQEYLGTYVTDPQSGKLVYRDGLLVQALRRGDWIVLDELNLAPTDVLEALNRLLDDNRELVVPETHEVIKPHPHFMLFATQNPPGAYGGRKVLSRALRSRFLEVHFDDVPQAELEYILSQRSRIAPSYSQKIVAVFSELQKRRQVSRIFEGKQGFATLRDLFRWAGRDASSYTELAENGYMLLAERTRREEDKVVVKEVIEKVMNVVISESTIYDMESTINSDSRLLHDGKLVWTKPMQRLFTLLSSALKHNEPVLLVGETGTGKTSVCQLYADITGKLLRTVNCHQNLEAADIIGGQRPVRRSQAHHLELLIEASEVVGSPMNNVTELQDAIKTMRESVGVDPIKLKRCLAIERTLCDSTGPLLEWQDGALLTSMHEGNIFLLDEISLADDSVLERLNSVLEPSRTIVLAERGGQDVEDHEVVATDGFQFIATMNPGGDFGKKELSPALRNRFTEIWVPSISSRQDLGQIINRSWLHNELHVLTKPILDFVEWISEQIGDVSVMTVRDILGWLSFCNAVYDGNPKSIPFVFGHGARMSILDGLASLSQLSSWSSGAVRDLTSRAFVRLQELLPGASTKEQSVSWSLSNDSLQVGPFAIPAKPMQRLDSSFSLGAPTALDNAMRVLRACQIQKPILLEGSPGVGKTSLVTALANVAGQRLTRINFSEQTDIVDLFGSDLPVEGGHAGQFIWRDAEFLRALQSGEWVLLDEMNLAPQAILEGLNAVFDHRGTVYIPELGRSFVQHPNFRVFAAQNPLQQGSGRKGLPKSFLNRFTKVYIEPMTPEDMFLVCEHVFPRLPCETLQSMVLFNSRLSRLVTEDHAFGRQGSPWEFNLRDILRWSTLLQHTRELGDDTHPSHHINTVYTCRFRNEQDRAYVQETFESTFGSGSLLRHQPPLCSLSPKFIQCGTSTSSRGDNIQPEFSLGSANEHIALLEAAITCISHQWLLILTGPRCSGKSNFVRRLAQLAGQPLEELSLHSASDTSDLIGSFEQVDHTQRIWSAVTNLTNIIQERFLTSSLVDQAIVADVQYLQHCQRSPSALSADSVREICARIRVWTNKEDVFIHHILDDLQGSLENSRTDKSQFHWVDGPLVEAMKTGRWLLLNDVNRCSAAVLDRLNSLCEPGGKLILTEKGLDQVPVESHPNFRLFMVYDPSGGEISRAMRNRGIELSIVIPPSMDAFLQAHRLPSSLSTIGSLPSSKQSAFENFRRLLATTARHDYLATMTLHSLSSSLDYEDSSCARLCDAIKVLRPDCFVTGGDEVVLFTFQLTSESHPHHLRRLLRCYPDGANLVDKLGPVLKAPHAGMIFDVLRQKYARTQPLLHLMAYQPFNFFLGMNVNFLGDPDDPITLGVALDTFALAHIVDGLVSGIAGLHARSNELQTASINMLKAIVQAALAALAIGNGAKENLRTAKELLVISEFMCDNITTGSFDYTVALVLATWIQSALEHAPTISEDAQVAWNSLSACVKLASGQGLMLMWKAVYLQLYAWDSLDVVQRVLDVARSNKAVGKLDQSLSLQKRLFEVVSVLSVTLDKSIQDGLVNDLLRLCEEHLESSNIDSALSPPDGVEVLPFGPLLTRELSLLAGINVLSGVVNTSSVNGVISRACINLRDHLPRMISYQQLLWAVQAGKRVLPNAVRSHIEWHKAIWRNHNISEISGPGFLFSPVLLYQTFSLAHWKVAKLDSFQHLLVKHSNQRDLVFESCHSKTRYREIMSLLVQNLVIFCASLRGPFQENDLAPLGYMHEIEGYSAGAIRIVIDVMSRCRDQHILSLLQTRLLPCLLSLQTTMDSTDVINDIGKCWVALAEVNLETYVPELPIDPSVASWCNSRYWIRRKAGLQTLLDLYTSYEELLTGQRTNDTIANLQEELQSAEKSLQQGQRANDGSHFVVEPSRLRLWDEIRSFRREVVSTKSTLDVIAALEQRDPLAQQREQMMQDSVSNFVQRVQVSYRSEQDLFLTVEYALLQLKFGLRLVSISSVSATPSALNTNGLQALVSYPPAIGLKLQQEPVPPLLVCGSFTETDAIIHQLCCVLVDVSQTGNLKAKQGVLQSAYSRLFGLWQDDRAKAAIEEQNAQSIYRHSDKDVEAELEEIAIRRLFPTYEDNNEEKVLPNKIQQAHISPQHGQDLFLTHANIFLGGSDHGHLDHLQKYNRRCVEAWLENQYTVMTDALDMYSFPLRARFMYDLDKELNGSRVKNNNFYTDVNVPELTQLFPIVDAMRQKLLKLIATWPEQTVLQHLAERCDQVMAIRLDSPIAKALTAAEQLLQHSDDWEMYANKENSLLDFRHSLTNIIVNWRKLELSGWRDLLNTEATLIESSIWEWWFRLYEVLVHEPTRLENSIDTSINDVDAYLDRLDTLLEDFIRSAPLGQFKCRLGLLKTFEVYLDGISSGTMGVALSRTNTILGSLNRYYGRFIQKATTSLSEQRAAMEKDIRDFIKLASWRDVNVHSLRQSAKHSHRQLYKKVRQFREILRQPVTPFLTDNSSYIEKGGDDRSDEHHPLRRCPVNTFEGPTDGEVSYAAKFTRVLSGATKRTLQDTSTALINNLAKDVIGTVEDLAHSQVPPGLDPTKTKKWHSSRMTQKRRAWNDLLKELKRLGIPQNLKPEILSNQVNRRWLMELRNVGASTNGGLDVTAHQIDEYFYRSMDVLIELRSSMANHHDDITTRDLSRGVMLAESTFNIAIRCRRMLSYILCVLPRLSAVRGRVQEIVNGTTRCVGDEDLAQSCMRIKDLVGRTNAILNDLRKDYIELIKARIPAPPSGNDRIEEELNKHVAIYEELKPKISRIIDDIYSTNPQLVTEDNLRFVQASLEQLRITVAWLDSLEEQEATFQPFCHGVKEFLSQEIAELPALNTSVGTNVANSRPLVETLLVIAQHIDSQPTTTDPNEDDENHVHNHIIQYLALSKVLKVKEVLEVTSELLSQIPHCSVDSVQSALSQALPLLDEYAFFLDDFISCVAYWNRAILKLLFIIACIMRRISKEGFCRPPEGEEKSSGGDGSLENADGTGFGEGSGQQDVTGQIENDGQIEGLQGDDQNDDNKPEQQNQDEGLEVDADMFGDMDGFVDEGGDEGDNPEGEDEEEQSLSDLDDEMDKHDGENIDTVDENFWGSKDEEETQKFEGKADEKNEQSEMAAKEEGEKGKGEEHLGMDEEQKVEDDAEGERKEDEGSPPEDAPRGQEMTGDDKNNKSPDLDQKGEEQADGEMQPGEDEENILNDEAEMEDGIEEGDANADATDEMEVDEQDGIAENADTNSADDVQDDNAPEGGSEEKPGPAKEADVTEGGDPSSDAAADSKGTIKQTRGEPGSSTDDNSGDPVGNEAQDDAPLNDESTDSDVHPDVASKPNAVPSSNQNASGTSSYLDYNPIPNPLRNLGDALKEVRRRLQEIQAPDSNAPPGPKPSNEEVERGPVEYAQEDGDADMQALGPAGEEEAERLEKLKLEEDGMEEEKGGDALVDEDAEMRDMPQFIEREEVDLVPPKRIEKDKDESEEQVSKSALSQNQARRPEEQTADDDTVPAEAEVHTRSPSPEQTPEDSTVESTLIHWRNAGQPSSEAHNIWRMYESLTHHLSFTLCEQLRLILEPTKATRLQGDFRTGKRLNMKKIIPYIASDYTKDKIWLRRTRPSQREYQVLIALDDSRSMAESHSVHLALETLALVSKALNRLEVGDVAVAKFGAHAEIVHGFEDGPFSDAAGAKVVEAFKFDQGATDVLGLLETSVGMLAEAREKRGGGSGGSGELWQLMIIISDGVCQEHEKLRATLRRAAEQRVLVVFVVIDASTPKTNTNATVNEPKLDNSIINMTQASYKLINGRMELQMRRYLDSFPFEFFAILRNVETLPEVLSDTLKQFFERVVGDTRFN